MNLNNEVPLWTCPCSLYVQIQCYVFLISLQRYQLLEASNGPDIRRVDRGRRKVKVKVKVKPIMNVIGDLLPIWCWSCDKVKLAMKKLKLKLRVIIWSRTTHTNQIFLKGRFLTEKIERNTFDLLNLKRKIVSFNILFHLILHILPYLISSYLTSTYFIVSFFNLFHCIFLQLISLYLTSIYFIVSYFNLFYCISSYLTLAVCVKNPRYDRSVGCNSKQPFTES